MLFVFNNDLRLVLCSHSCIHFLRYDSFNDIRNQSITDVFRPRLVKSWVDKIVVQCQNCLTTQEPFQYNDKINFTDSRFASINAEITISPVMDETDTLRGTVISIADTTALTAMIEKAEAASVMKNNFLANMSHEIRTPMNAVKGLSELLLMTKLNTAQHDYIKKIVSSSHSLLHIINDVLDFSKIEAGKMEIIPARYSLRDIINEVTNVINLRASEKDLLFLVDIDPHLPSYLNGDDVRIKQIIINLLSNAVKYTQQGFVRLGVQGEVLGNTLTMQISVHDSGVGIHEEELPFLFEAFQRSDMHTHKTIIGTGLGLAITQKFTEAMNGSIQVQSEYGKGSTFTVSIPQEILDDTPIATVTAQDIGIVLIYTPENRTENIRSMLNSLSVDSVWCHSLEQLETLSPAVQEKITHCLYLESFAPLLVTDLVNTLNTGMCAQPEQLQNKIERRTLEQLHGKKALIVDDNEINLIVGENLVQSYGLDTLTVTSGQDALNICATVKFDIIFMDHMMAGLDGIETTTALRKKVGLNQRTPIIALTANVLNNIQQDFLDSGMNDFIAKPIDMDELYRVLTMWAIGDDTNTFTPISHKCS